MEQRKAARRESHGLRSARNNAVTLASGHCLSMAAGKQLRQILSSRSARPSTSDLDANCLYPAFTTMGMTLS